MKMKKILGLRTYCEKKTCSRGRVPEKPYKGMNTSRCSGHKSESTSTGTWMLVAVWVRASRTKKSDLYRTVQSICLHRLLAPTSTGTNVHKRIEKGSLMKGEKDDLKPS